MPITVANEPNHPLLHFHVCIHCGSTFRREASPSLFQNGNARNVRTHPKAAVGWH